MRRPSILFFTPAPPNYAPPPALSDRMLVCGPHMETDCQDGIYRSIRTPSGRFDLSEVTAFVPPDQQPDVVVVWADASRIVEPHNLGVWPAQKILIIGDTHHQERPIQTLLEYAASEPFDTHIIVATRQHAHFFMEAGLQRVFWIPSLVATPVVKPFRESRRPVVTFVGQIGRLHPRRRRIIDRLISRGYPIEALQCSREEAAERYATSLISLNISLNSDLNFRPYEIPAAGGFLLTDRLSEQAGLSRLYEDGKQYASYDGPDELCAKIERYLTHPEEAIAIARAGQTVYLATLNRDKIESAFWDVVLDGRSDAAFSISGEASYESRTLSTTANVATHAALYEFFQRQHLRKERPQVLFLPGASDRLLVDLSDLPRLDIRSIASSHDTTAIPATAPQPVTLSPEEAAARAWDILVLAPGHLQSDEERGEIADSYQFQFLVAPGLPTESLDGLAEYASSVPAASDAPILRHAPTATSVRGGDARRQLHIGGTVRAGGWEVLNAVPGPVVDHVGDATDLSRFDDQTFATVYASHVLEHIDYNGALSAALREWHRVLKPGGNLLVSVPDLDVLCRLFTLPALSLEDRFFVMRMMFGGHVDAHDYHLVGLNQGILTAFLEDAGFVDIDRVDDFGIFQDTSLLRAGDVPISVNMIANRALVSERP